MEEKYKPVSLPTLIGENDILVPSVEELVSAPKIVVEIEGGKRKHNAPNEFTLRVKPSSSHSRRLIVLARKGGGRRFISLVTEQGDVLRQYHYDYSGHGNPNHTTVGQSHKHFPTRNYPLRGSHKGIETWAYDPGLFPEDFVDAVKHFCKECNVVIQGLQERLPLRWFR